MSGLAYRHQRAQRLRKLVARRSARLEEGCFVLEGVNLLEEALTAGTAIEGVYVDEAWASAAPTGSDDDDGTSRRLGRLLQRCHDDGTKVWELAPGVLARVAGTVTPQPVLAIAQVAEVTMADLAARRLGLVVVCVDVRDPGNGGTVARSAWAAGADAVVCCDGTVDMFNPKAVRASAGAVLHVPVVSAGAAGPALDQIGSWGLARWGTVVEGGQDYAAADLLGPVALVFGNEASGLPVTVLGDRLDGLVSIPMAAGAESLNVGMAAAVLCFDVARRRRHA